MVDHYTWFLAFPMAYHTMLVVAPDFPLNSPLYLLSIVAWMYNLLKAPFWNVKLYKALFLVSVMLMLPITALWWFRCMGEFKWEE